MCPPVICIQCSMEVLVKMVSFNRGAIATAETGDPWAASLLMSRKLLWARNRLEFGPVEVPVIGL